MKKLNLTIVTVLISLFFSYQSIAQTATATVSYTGFMACDGCLLCGGDYWCINTNPSYCGATAGCLTKTFFDPVPAGKTVTNVTARYYSGGCAGSYMAGSINGYAVPTVNDANTGCLCSDNPCVVAAVSSNNYPCGMPGYVYGGTNSLQLCTGTSVCINRVELVFTYVNPDVIFPSITPSGPTSFCQGGSVNLNAGTGYSAYHWSTGATSQTITASSTGTYTVSVTSTTGCTTGSASISVNSYPNPAVSISKTNITCAGSNNGTATANPSGGTPGYSYSWSNGQSTQTATNLAAITYYVTVYDSHSCSTTGSITITAPSALSASISSQTNVSCYGGATGSATVTASGGTPGYTYIWAPSGGSGSTATNLSAGTYTVTVRDANNCSSVQTATITQPTALTGTASATNTSCNGGSNGTATASPSGGTPGYTYYWFPSGQTSNPATGLSTGTYSVTITDTKGCTIVRTATVNQPAAIALTTSKIDATCGNANGSATVSASGGTPGYTYAWSNGGSTSTITNIAAGSYTVTVRDVNNCSSIATVSVNNTGAPSVSVTSSTNINCFGGSNGSATISASGGTPGYTYLWSNSNTGTSITNVTANTYSITVTDAIGCQATTSIIITQPPILTASITDTTTPSCFGGNNGTATVSTTGGSPGYTYYWTNGANTPTASGLTAGSYSVTVTDTHNCTTTVSTVISQPSALSAVITASTNVSCNSGSDGSITVSASGGTVNYTYLWTGGGSTPTITNIPSGTYYVTVTDANGCTAVTNTTIIQPSAILLTIPSITNVYCFGSSTGQATAQVSGGTSPYTYLWSNGILTPTNSGLSAGTYTITVTDNNGCTSTNSATITQIDAINPTMTVNQNVSCNGGSNGSATVSAIGGTSPYQYTWSTGGSQPTASGLNAGTHYVTITDVNGCTSVASVDITEPQLLSTSFVVDSVLCNGGTTGNVNLITNGGTFPFTYIWTNNSTFEDLTNVGAGSYSVTVTDNNSCTTTQSVTVYEPTPIASTFTSSPANCGMSDGSISISVSGGSPSYSYLWDSAAGNNTTTSVNALPSGTYFVTVTDSNSCTSVFSGDISNTNAATIAFDVVNNNLCNGDSTGFAHAYITTGGTAPFSFVWSNGSVTDSIYNVVAGVYNVTVTDANGCESIQSVTLTEPDNMQISMTSNTQISCYGGNDGSLTIQVLGGTSPYLYLWQDSLGNSLGNSNTLNNLSMGALFLTVTDVNNCVSTFNGFFTQPTQLVLNAVESISASCYNSTNGEAIANPNGGTPPYSYIWFPGGQITQTATGLSAGTYSVTVTDFQGCSTVDTVHINAPTQLQIIGNVTSANCNASNGSVSININGGTQPYAINWSTSSTNDTIINLASGTYTVTVTDANSCSSVYSAVVNNLVAGTIQVTQLTNVLCYGDSNGSITVFMQGGTAPFTYVWSSGQITGTVNNLSSGNYSVTIYDNNNCWDDTTITIIGPSSALSSSITSQNISCVGSNDGVAVVNVSYGTSPYTYLWNEGQVTSTISNLVSGNYSVTVSDVNNCTTTNQTTINQPTPIQFSLSSNNPLCGNGSDGTAEITNVNGGTPPYTYSWTGGQTTSIATGLSSGIYVVTITDSLYCDTTAIATLYNPPSMNISDTAGIDATNNLGYINITVLSGGMSPFTYHWLNDSITTSSTFVVTNLPAGEYVITITDANTCQITDTFTIDIQLKIPSVITPNKDGTNDDFEILGIAGYNDVSIEIYNRWGDILYVFKGTGMEYTDATRRWNGIYKGKDLPMGSYVYIIKLGPEKDPITGVVSIIR